MVAGERDELRLPVHENAPLQPVGHGERGTLHLVHEGDVQPARLHRTQQGVGGHVDAQRDVGAGQGDAQPAQPAADDPARGGADPQPGAAGPRGLRLRERVADQVVHALDEGAGPVEDGAPQGGGPAAGPFAPEQFGAQDVLDPPQLGGERGLAHAEPAGRLVQAARVRDGAQRLRCLTSSSMQRRLGPAPTTHQMPQPHQSASIQGVLGPAGSGDAMYMTWT